MNAIDAALLAAAQEWLTQELPVERVRQMRADGQLVAFTQLVGLVSDAVAHLQAQPATTSPTADRPLDSSTTPTERA